MPQLQQMISQILFNWLLL